MFKIELNNPNLKTVVYHTLDQTYTLQQIVGEELVVPLVLNKIKKVFSEERDLFKYEKYKIVDGWNTESGRLPKYLILNNNNMTDEDIVEYSQKIVEVNLSYECDEVLLTNDYFIIYAIIQSSESLQFDRVFSNQGKVKLEVVDSIPDNFANEGIADEIQKQYNYSVLGKQDFEYVLKFTISNFKVNTGKQTLKLKLPIYNDNLKYYHLAILNLSIDLTMLTSPEGD